MRMPEFNKKENMYEASIEWCELLPKGKIISINKGEMELAFKVWRQDPSKDQVIWITRSKEELKLDTRFETHSLGVKITKEQLSQYAQERKDE